MALQLTVLAGSCSSQISLLCHLLVCTCDLFPCIPAVWKILWNITEVEHLQRIRVFSILFCPLRKFSEGRLTLLLPVCLRAFPPQSVAGVGGSSTYYLNKQKIVRLTTVPTQLECTFTLHNSVVESMGGWRLYRSALFHRHYISIYLSPSRIR